MTPVRLESFLFEVCYRVPVIVNTKEMSHDRRNRRKKVRSGVVKFPSKFNTVTILYKFIRTSMKFCVVEISQRIQHSDYIFQIY